MCASVGLGSRVVKVTIPTVEIFGLSAEVPVKVQPPVPELNITGATTVPPVPVVPPLAPPPVPDVPPEPPDPPPGPHPSPTRNRAPHQTVANEVLFIVAAAAYGSVSPSSTSPSTETRSTSARSGATWTRAYPESGQ